MDTLNCGGEDITVSKESSLKSVELFCLLKFFKKLCDRGVGTNSTEAISKNMTAGITCKMGKTRTMTHIAPGIQNR